MPSQLRKHGRSTRPAGSFLEYIVATGEQYINTAIIPSSQAELVMTLSVELGHKSIRWAGVAESNSDGNDVRFSFTASVTSSDGLEGNAIVVRNQTINSYIAPWGYLEQSVPITIKALLSGCWYDNALVSYERGSFDYSLPLYIGAVNEYGTPLFCTSDSFTTAYNIYAVVINDNGETVGNFIPYQLNSGEVGMLNTVTNQFHSNQGTGAFIAGSAI